MFQAILLAALSIFVLYFSITKIYKQYVYWNTFFKIPGVPGYPVIGNLLDVMEPPVKVFLSDRIRNKENYPIYRMYGLGQSLVMLLKPEDVELILSNPIHNEKSQIYQFVRNWLGTGLLTSKGKKWHTRRKILTPAFHFTILQKFVHVFNKEAKNLVAHILSRKDEPYIDVVKPITEFTLESIGETSMGIKLNSVDKNAVGYKQAIHGIGEILVYRITRFWCVYPSTYFFTPTRRKEQKLIKRLHAFSRDVIKNRQNARKKEEFTSYSSRKRLAMLDLLIKAQEDGENIDEEGIREEVDTFMFEGHDTTSMGICFILLLLANHEEVQESIYQEIVAILGDDIERMPSYNDLQEMTYMERCVKESLRLYPSVPVIGRTCGEDVRTTTGYVIPKGCDIFFYIYDLHRNPEIYPDPEKFDPDRFLIDNVTKRHHFAYLPFSAGSRNCIGQRFAILEIKAALCALLRHFTLEKIDTPSTIVLKSDLVMRPEGPIRVKFVPRIL